MKYCINGVETASLPRRKIVPLTMTIDQFGSTHGLTMKINGDSTMGYTASFECVEIMEAGFLISKWGRGNTIKEAMKDYASQISNTKIAHNAYKRNRVEIDVPILTVR